MDAATVGMVIGAALVVFFSPLWMDWYDRLVLHWERKRHARDTEAQRLEDEAERAAYMAERQPMIDAYKRGESVKGWLGQVRDES